MAEHLCWRGFEIPDILEDYLTLWAKECPQKVALICKGDAITYSQLLERVIAKEAELKRQGLTEGMAMPIPAVYDPDFLVTYFATHLLGAGAVPLPPHHPSQLEGICNPNHPSPYHSSSANHSDSKSNQSPLPWGGEGGGFEGRFYLILFTTGTTGCSKGVIISREAILADAENLVEAHQYSHDITFIVNGPLNHLGSLSKIWPTLMVGGTIHLVETIKDPADFFLAVDNAHGKVATFLVPANIRMLLTLSKKQLAQRADKIDFIETGAAPISQADMEQLCNILPSTRLYNTYASTETGIVCTYNYNNGNCLAGCVGKPMKHSSVFITPDGTVACTGKTIMTGYLNHPYSPHLFNSSILQSFNPSPIIYTHDQGYIDEEGNLHLAGRTDDIINTGGYKVNPVEVEDAALECPFVADCVCVPAPHPVLGTAIRLIVVTKDNEPLDKRALATFLASRLDPYKLPQLFTQTDKLKRTFNGKLDRKNYLNEQ
jgi:acyl-CoA synthetase (AMP-forming)/AMP-acid ligase II